jgi:Flp pilus assembly pilin Flp
VIGSAVAVRFAEMENKQDRPMTPLYAYRSRLAGRSREFVQDSKGATAIEYAIIAAAVAGAIIGTIAALGTKIVSLYQSIGAAL